MRSLRIGLSLLALLLAGCSNGRVDIFGKFVTMEPEPTLSGDIQPVLTSTCALSGCHSGIFPAEGLNLEPGRLYMPGSGAVGVNSVQSLLKRIQPGDAEASYLIDKIQGTQSGAGGSGQQMPPDGATPLSPATILAFRKWVDAGTLNN